MAHAMSRNIHNGLASKKDGGIQYGMSEFVSRWSFCSFNMLTCVFSMDTLLSAAHMNHTLKGVLFCMGGNVALHAWRVSSKYGLPMSILLPHIFCAALHALCACFPTITTFQLFPTFAGAVLLPQYIVSFMPVRKMWSGKGTWAGFAVCGAIGTTGLVMVFVLNALLCAYGLASEQSSFWVGFFLCLLVAAVDALFYSESSHPVSWVTRKENSQG